MSNGEFCCAIGLCCPPASASRRAALISELSHGMSEKSFDASDDAANATAQTLEHVADWLIENVDMAPKGTLDFSKLTDAMKHHG